MLELRSQGRDVPDEILSRISPGRRVRRHPPHHLPTPQRGHVTAAQDHIRRKCVRHPLEGPVLAVSEAVTNIPDHGDAAGTLSIRTGPARATVEVEDVTGRLTRPT
ncbi:hypothetical protein [Nonomuraea jiangxiensis]|uniref:hypothetical protein n=1 Tax=Nonomuraea jiangxiensis TaxID=633440 RepID=UPI0015A3F824|nr:hypothetical protein [Nonomuraea jiangxiensis]